MKLTKGRKLALLFFIGTILFATGLVIFPDVTIELYEGNDASIFVIIGILFFLTGSYIGWRG